MRLCKSRAERGQLALEWLSERCGADCAFLFEIVDGEPVWIASTLQTPPGAEVHELARRHLGAELSVRELTTGGLQEPSSGSITRDGAFRPVLLQHPGEGTRLVTGLVVFAVRAGQVFVYPGDAARRLSRVLHELGAVAVTTLLQ
jgi:hypothetical protein